jgi:hypothetical protein
MLADAVGYTVANGNSVANGLGDWLAVADGLALCERDGDATTLGNSFWNVVADTNGKCNGVSVNYVNAFQRRVAICNALVLADIVADTNGERNGVPDNDADTLAHALRDALADAYSKRHADSDRDSLTDFDAVALEHAKLARVFFRACERQRSADLDGQCDVRG